jgi:DNA gyrase inhibitor GyrI
VAKPVKGEEDITCYELPGGQMAKIVHKGPYEKCAAGYKKLWMDGGDMHLSNSLAHKTYDTEPVIYQRPNR